MNNCTEKPSNTGRTPNKKTKVIRQERKNIVQSQSDGTKTRSAEPVRAEGKTRRDMVLWDDIALNADKSNDPRYNRTNAERAKHSERFKVRRC